MLYSNSHQKKYNVKLITKLYELLKKRNLVIIDQKLKINFLFKIFFLENINPFTKTFFYKNYLKHIFLFKKINYLLIIFFIKTFLQQIKKMLKISFLMGYNNLNIFFIFLTNNSIFFNHFYSVFFKKYYHLFNNLKKMYSFKKKYLYKFKFWFILKKFLRKCQVKLLILWNINRKPMFRKFLKFINIATFSFDSDVRNPVVDYSLGIRTLSTFQKIFISQFILNSFIQGNYLSKKKKFFNKCNNQKI